MKMRFLATLLFITIIPCLLAKEKSLEEKLTEKSFTKLKENLGKLVGEIEKKGEILRFYIS